MGRMFLVLLGVVVVGGVLTGVVWHEVSEALMGRIHVPRLAAAAALLGVLLVLLSRLRRYLLALGDGSGEGGRELSSSISGR